MIFFPGKLPFDAIVVTMVVQVNFQKAYHAGEDQLTRTSALNY